MSVQKGAIVHVVLYVMGGVPEDPQVFESEWEAQERFTELVNEEFHTTFEEFSDAAKFYDDQEHHDNDIYLFDAVEVE